MLRRASDKISCILISIIFCLTTSMAMAEPRARVADYFAGLQLALEKGDLTPYLNIQKSSNSRVQKIALSPEKFGGENHTVFLIFDENQRLTHFSVDDQDPISLAPEQRALLAIAKDNKELLNNFFATPSPQLKNALAQILEPVTNQISGKIADGLKTRQGEWIANASSDVGSLGKKAFRALKLKAYLGGNLTFRAIDTVNGIILGSWIIVSTLALPILPALGIIPAHWLIDALPSYAIGVVAAFGTRKVISKILGRMIRITGEQIKVLQRQGASPIDGVEFEDIGDSIDQRLNPISCDTRLKKLANFIFR